MPQRGDFEGRAGLFGERGEVGDQGLEAVDGQAVRGAAGGLFGERRRLRKG